MHLSPFWVTWDHFSLSCFMFGLINRFIPAAESTSQNSAFPKSSGLVVKWFQMSGRVMYGIIPRVLLACAHHPKLDDLNSISCLLSMRLYRHANNRKFALKGIDQQPLTLNHDSEVSHDSSASERLLVFFLYTLMKTEFSLGLSCESQWESVGFCKKSYQQCFTPFSNTHLTLLQRVVTAEHSPWPVFRKKCSPTWGLSESKSQGQVSLWLNNKRCERAIHLIDELIINLIMSFVCFCRGSSRLELISIITSLCARGSCRASYAVWSTIKGQHRGFWKQTDYQKFSLQSRKHFIITDFILPRSGTRICNYCIC